MREPISAWHEKYRPLLSEQEFGRFAEEVPSMPSSQLGTAERLARVGSRAGWEELAPPVALAERADRRGFVRSFTSG